MKRTLIASAILFGTLPGSTQISEKPEGAYRNSMDFTKGEVLTYAKFAFKQIKLDTTFYKVSTKDKDTKKYLRKHVIWGIYQNSVLYLNAKRLGMKKHYVEVQEIGKYCYLIGRPIRENDQKNLSGKTPEGVLGGLVGSGVNQLFITASIRDQIHYIVDLDTGVPHLLTRPYLEHILASEEKLLARYGQETNPSHLLVMLKYVWLLNSISVK